MSDLNTLLAAIESERLEGRESVLATVVRVEGAAYRRPGARMLVSQYGRPQGTISGGCLEEHVAKIAWWLTEAGPVIRSYSTAEGYVDEDGEKALGFGLGCNGNVFVLFERVPASQASALLEILRGVKDRQRPAAIATVIATGGSRGIGVGERLFLTADQAINGQFLDRALSERVAHDLRLIREQQRSSLGRYAGAWGEIEVLLEYVAPAQRLVIFGAGHDVQPLVRMAKLMSWHVTVIDGRSHFARAERFPEADAVIVGDIRLPFGFGDMIKQAAVVVMTHSLSQDAHWLKGVLQGAPGYVGQLGPRDRTERLLSAIGQQAGELPGLDKLHYPMGLDLGGDSPQSVAMAVLAEINAVLNGRAGGSLKLRASGIHQSGPVEPDQTMESWPASFAEHR